jgi:L-lactate permease
MCYAIVACLFPRLLAAMKKLSQLLYWVMILLVILVGLGVGGLMMGIATDRLPDILWVLVSILFLVVVARFFDSLRTQRN